MMRDYNSEHKVGSLSHIDIELDDETLLSDAGYEMFKAYLHYRIDSMRCQNFFVYKVEERSVGFEDRIIRNVCAVFRLHLIKLKEPILELKDRSINVKNWKEIK